MKWENGSRKESRGPFSHFTTVRQNSLENPAFRTSAEGRGCFAVCDQEKRNLGRVSGVFELCEFELTV